MKTKLFLLTLSTCLVFNLQAQKKLNEALYQFENTAFMKQFREMKNKAKSEVIVFKQEQTKYLPRDIQNVKMVYNETARRFNKILTDIKRDFLDKGKMKYIQEFPDSYSKGLELELYKLSDFYNSQFRQTVRDVTGEETFGSPLLVLLPQLVMLSSDLIKQMQQIKKERVRFTENYLQEKWIIPNRFPYWEEVGQTNSNYPNDPYNNGGTDTWNNEADTWNNTNTGGWDNNNTNTGGWNNNNTNWDNTGENNSNDWNGGNNTWNTNSRHATNNNNVNSSQGNNNLYQKQVTPTKPSSTHPSVKLKLRPPPNDPKPQKKKGKAQAH